MNKLACLLGAAMLLTTAPSFATDVRVSAYVGGVALDYRDHERHRHHRGPHYDRRPVHHYPVHHAPVRWRNPAVIYYSSGYGDHHPPRHHHGRHCHH